MAIVVNYYDQVVYVTSPTTNVTVQELLDALREAEDTSEGLAFGGPVKTVTDGFVDGEGEAALGGGFSTSLTITLDDNWYIEFWDGVSLGIVADGNVTGGKDSRPVRCAVGSADTALVLGAERGVITSGGTVSPSDIADIADAVWDEELADHISSGTYGQEVATKADILAATASTDTTASSGTVNEGTGSGDYTDTFNRDDIYWEITEDAVSGIDVELTFNIPDDDRPGVFKVFGRYVGSPGNSHFMNLYGYNFETDAWEQLVTEFMPGGFTSDDEFSYEYYERNIDRTNNNQIKFRIVHAVSTYNPSHVLYLDYAEVTSIEVITAGDIANAVWDEATTDHEAAGSFGLLISKMWKKIKFIVGEI